MASRWMKYAILVTAAFLFVTSLGTLLFLTLGPGRREIVRTTEKELKVKLEAAFGKVFLSRGDPKKICTIQFKKGDREETKGKISYRLDDGVGILNLELNKSGHSEVEEVDEDDFDFSELEAGNWYLRFTDAIPISFHLELGLGKGDFDFSGLLVKDFKLSTGASSVVLRFREPNKTVMETMRIESGVSRFVGHSLGNANFRRFEFSGGVGSYTLDFTGELREEVDVKIEVGLGAVTILLPRDVGARVVHEGSWISKIDVDRDFQQKRDGQYITDNYNTARGRMNITVESGFCHIKIKRTRP